MPVPRFPLLALLALTAACQPAGATPPASAVVTPGPATPPAAAKAGPAATTPTPLDGLWRQASVNCADGRVPNEKVEELDFGDAGFFSVTYAPFETYKDYWGHARFDLAKGEVVFTREGGNFIPTGLDLAGRARLETNTLTISDVWFGDRAPGAPAGTGCTYVFSRYLGGE